MKSPKVRLHIRVITADGRSVFAKPVWNKNRTLRAGYAEVDSNHHPEGVYYLRLLRDGKRVWEAVGREPDAAIVALRRTEHELQATSLGLTVITTSSASREDAEAPTTKISLHDAIGDYLKDLSRFRDPGTVKGAKQMLSRLDVRFPGRCVNDICKKDLLDHMDALKADGLGNRTIFNHLIRIGALLRVHGVTGLLSASDKPLRHE